MKHKILYVNLFPEIGGAETSLLYLLKSLDKKKFEPIVLVSKEGYFSKRLTKLNCKVVFLPLPGYIIQQLFIPGASPKGLIDFYFLCKKLQPDLVHLTHVTLALYTVLPRIFLHIPVLATSWMNSDSVYWYQDVITNLAIDKIHAITAEIQNLLTKKRIIPKEKITIAVPGVDTSYFRPSKDKTKAKKMFGVSKDFLTVTITSRFDPVKDYQTFLQAMSFVVRKIAKTKVLISQDPKINLEKNNASAPTIKKAIDEFLKKDKQLKENVIFTGYQEDMLAIYHATDVLISSSLYESLGMTHMEAASCGIPVVSTNKDSQYLIVKDGKTGFLVSPKNPETLAEKVSVLLQDETLRITFGKNARLYIVKTLDIHKYAQTIQTLYTSLLKKTVTVLPL